MIHSLSEYSLLFLLSLMKHLLTFVNNLEMEKPHLFWEEIINVLHSQKNAGNKIIDAYHNIFGKSKKINKDHIFFTSLLTSTQLHMYIHLYIYIYYIDIYI